MARKKWRLNRNYAHAHFRILSGKRTGHQSKSENFRIQLDTCGRLKTIRIRCVWTRKFSHPQKNICGKKNSGYAWTWPYCQRNKKFILTTVNIFKVLGIIRDGKRYHYKECCHKTLKRPDKIIWIFICVAKIFLRLIFFLR